MMANATPTLVYIDDEGDVVEELKNRLDKHANVVQIVTETARLEEVVAQIRTESLKADIIVSDWNLKTTLISDNGLGFADGGALIEGIASWRRNRDFVHVIFSGELQNIEALEEVPEKEFKSHPHILSRRLGVDWVGQKHLATGFYATLEQLCLAVRRIKDLAQRDVPKQSDSLYRLLAADNEKIVDGDLAEDISAYGPPKSELVESRRFDIVRWLLLEVLPYPTFLIDSEEIARRLRVNPDWFASAESELKNRLVSAKYIGILSDVGLGERWWARRVESTLWDLSDSGSLYGEAWRLKLESIGVPAEQILTELDPVIARGYFGASTGKMFNVSEMVRTNPPHWPSAATQAYARRADLREDPFLKQIADPNDIVGS